MLHFFKKKKNCKPDHVLSISLCNDEPRRRLPAKYVCVLCFGCSLVLGVDVVHSFIFTKKFARTCIYSTISLSYDSCTKRWLTNVATSPADLGHRIERVDGPDQAKRGLFAKKPSYLSEINPQSYFLSRFIFQKKPSTFTKINP